MGIRSYLEKIGKFLHQGNRLPLFLASLSICPLLASFVLYNEMQTFKELEETSSNAIRRMKSAFQRKMRKETFLARHKNSDPYFLDKELESRSFLEQEKILLQAWLSHPAISNKEKLARRIHFLNSSDNRLSFAEADLQVSKICKERMEKQRHAVEVDAEDLKNLLSDIEETDAAILTQGRPQLLICSFSLTPKNTPLQNEVFEITMDLLKREFISK